MRNVHKLVAHLVALAAVSAQAFAGGPSVRIIDGTPASESNYPYVARLQLDGDLLCSGTLVGTRYILTAAHCFYDDRNRRAVGDTDLTVRLAGQEIGSTKVYIHPSYRSRSQACVEKETDAAVVELAADAGGVTPIPLIPSPVPVGASVEIVGYGTLGTGSGGQNNHIPPVGTVYAGSTVVEGFGDTPPEQDQNSSYYYWTFDSGEANTAAGDSGGPAFYDSGGQRYISGITCGGDGNAEFGTMSFNTRGDLIKAWVDSITGATPDNTAPGFASLSPKAGQLGKAFSYVIPVTGSLPLSVSTQGLPPGLTLSGTTISGTPTALGTYSVGVFAANDYGNAATTLQIIISGFQPTVTVRSALLQFDYVRGSRDFLDVSGKLSVGRNFKPAGKKVTIKIGRFSKTFRLTANGQSAGSGVSFFDLSGTFKGAAFRSQSVRFDLTLERVKLFSELSTLGFPSSFDASEGQQVPLPLTVLVNGVESSTTTILGFKSRSARWSVVHSN